MVQVRIALVLFICVLLVVEAVGSEDTLPLPTVSRRCKKLGICNRVANYPTMLAKKLIQELKDRNTIFADDSEDEISEEVDEELSLDIRTIGFDIERRIRTKHPKIYPRISNSDEEYSEEEDQEIKLCESKVQYQRPKLAESRNNTWHFILNDDEDPVQTYRSEVCQFSTSNCSDKLVLAPNYESACIQRWTFKEMYYINENKQIATDYFKVPTCCSCKLYHTNK
ncbi:uncharacterized protein LOC124532380 [Vanessa cardui]|uniref:uncharacterized protein LOC124532380 n=1 Tax=Vanessa cardui TaxID=171605 RepID=UPI001F13BACA|nr:uncharacterized protein LOC124532380 [Vanessa cardui]